MLFRIISPRLSVVSYKALSRLSFSLVSNSHTYNHLRQIYSSPTSFAKCIPTSSSRPKVVMAEKTSSIKKGRTRGDSQDANAPPAKKPMFSIFEKASNAPGTPADIQWTTHGTSFIVGEAFHPQSGSKVAAFDLDQTLIKVNGKHKWPKNADDWVWWAPGVPAHMKEVANSGYTIVVITNQNGLDGNKKKQDEMRLKFEKICGRLGIPMWILISMQKDHYRKPMTGLWHWLENRFDADDVEIDRAKSYYIGDAAGRHADWKAGAVKDFNNTDRKFAASLDLEFRTPEDFFLNQHCPNDKWSYGPFDPKAWPKNAPLFSPTSSPLLPSPATCEVIVFCGYPASGKTSFAQKYILPSGQYDYVNQDTLKSKDKCLKATEQSLQNKRAVVVDNTNADMATRASYIALAKKHGVPVRCFLFLADKNLATHNNYFRAFHRPLVEAAEKVKTKAPKIRENTTTTTTNTVTTTTTSDGPDKESLSTSTSASAETVTVSKVRDEPVRERLSEMVFASFANKYQEPQLQEGFTEIRRINFVPDEDIRATWERWYF